ncbi:IclR family transcriptional regulator domain-containing protein [Microbaculum marinum]|uniref:Helix-turn-helix domain-containing protein n=1 Tax=Microbaculum marinum TaxID=1764581 RepID=A0AAW9RVS6_9HYPH
MELSPVTAQTTDASTGVVDTAQSGSKPGRPAESVRCRTNSRHGLTDLSRRSYPPVESVCRALEILNAVNKLRIASINGLYEETKFPKSTIVRMLETLMSEGYVARDNMCGGYRVTSRVRELSSGYEGISRIIEVARPLAIDLTRRTKWPVAIGVMDGDEIAIQFWTGAISPWNTDSILGLRPDMEHSAMGRTYLAFCPAAERERHLARFRADPERNFDDSAERRFRLLLEQVRSEGYAQRDPRTWPYRRTTFCMPIREGDTVHAMISTSYFTTAIPKHKLAEQIIEPLRCTTTKIEEAFAFMNSGGDLVDHSGDEVEFGF